MPVRAYVPQDGELGSPIARLAGSVSDVEVVLRTADLERGELVRPVPSARCSSRNPRSMRQNFSLSTHAVPGGAAGDSRRSATPGSWRLMLLYAWAVEHTHGSPQWVQHPSAPRLCTGPRNMYLLQHAGGG